jgi:hypothetical protein
MHLSIEYFGFSPVSCLFVIFFPPRRHLIDDGSRAHQPSRSRSGSFLEKLRKKKDERAASKLSAKEKDKESSAKTPSSAKVEEGHEPGQKLSWLDKLKAKREADK